MFIQVTVIRDLDKNLRDEAEVLRQRKSLPFACLIFSCPASRRGARGSLSRRAGDGCGCDAVWFFCPSNPKSHQTEGLSRDGAEKESGIAQGRAAAADLWGEADDGSIKNSLSRG